MWQVEGGKNRKQAARSWILQHEVHAAQQTHSRALRSRKGAPSEAFLWNKTEAADRNKFTKPPLFYYYYLKLEKAPWVTTTRCKRTAWILLSFRVAGMEEAKRHKVTPGFCTPRSSPTHQAKDSRTPTRSWGCRQSS